MEPVVFAKGKFLPQVCGKVAPTDYSPSSAVHFLCGNVEAGKSQHRADERAGIWSNVGRVQPESFTHHVDVLRVRRNYDYPASRVHHGSAKPQQFGCLFEV